MQLGNYKSNIQYYRVMILISLFGVMSNTSAQTSISGGYKQGDLPEASGPIVHFCNRAQGSIVANGNFIWFGATDFVYRFRVDKPLKSISYDLYVGNTRQFSGTQSVALDGSDGNIYLIAEQVAISGFVIPLPGVVIHGGRDRPSLKRVSKSEFDDSCYELTKVDLVDAR